jgi:hypothetical protein
MLLVEPPTDNTGAVGTVGKTWANGQFTNLTVDNALTVGSNIQLGPSDELRMGGAASYVLLHDGTNNIIRSNESDLLFQDSTTTRIRLFRTTGAISASGGMTASGFFGTASHAVSSSFATTASFALNAGGSGFPFSGSAVITGSLTITSGSLSMLSGAIFVPQSTDTTTPYYSFINRTDTGLLHTLDGFGVDYLNIMLRGVPYISMAYTADGAIRGISFGDGVEIFSNLIPFSLAGDNTIGSTASRWDKGFFNTLSATGAITASIVSASSFTSSLSNQVGFFGTASRAVTSSFATTSSFASTGGSPAFPFSGSAVITGSLVLTNTSGLFRYEAEYNGVDAYVFNVDGASHRFRVNGGDGIVFTGQNGTFAPDNNSSGISLGNPTQRWNNTYTNNLFVSGTNTQTGSLNILSGSITITNGGVTSSLFGTASNALSSSWAPPTFPFTGSAIISGSLNVTGSTTVLGSFSATTKSFLINHQRLAGKKLVYGVVEAPEHSVLVRGKLSFGNIITLPDEWEWLVDMDTITVQLTPIGTHQALFVDSISGTQVHIGIAGQWNSDIHCYYLVQATRKDVAPLDTVV